MESGDKNEGWTVKLSVVKETKIPYIPATGHALHNVIQPILVT